MKQEENTPKRSRRAASIENLQKAWQTPQNEAQRRARQNNGLMAGKIRLARSILKKIPAGAQSGTVISMSGGRKFELIDVAPLEQNGHWEQRFNQSGSRTIYGVTREFTGVVRIVWEYLPTLENIMDRPVLKDEDEQ